MKGFLNFIVGFITDSKNRPAIELLAGIVLLVPTSIYAFGGFGPCDNGTLSLMLGFILVLFGLNTAGNIFDKGAS